NMKTYQHSPLDDSHSIRLVMILPGQHDEVILCQLFEGHITDCPPYKALSYAWGDPTPIQSIVCDDEEFKITKNLETALRRCASTGSMRYASTKEICLGVQASGVNDDRHLPKRRKIGHLTWAVGPVYERCDGSDPQAFPIAREPGTEHKSFAELGLPDDMSYEWEAFRSLFHQPWFSRMWVIQEVAMNIGEVYPVLLYGTREVCWIDLTHVCQWAARRELPWSMKFLEDKAYTRGNESFPPGNQ
ncbi:MAG: hypothetical protein M1830_007922, partial [Pleopsidium flavum]